MKNSIYVKKETLKTSIMLFAAAISLFVFAFYLVGMTQEIMDDECSEKCYNNLTSSCETVCPDTINELLIWRLIVIIIIFVISIILAILSWLELSK